MRSVAGGIDGLGAVFDDGSLVADGGLLLAGTVMHRLGLEALIDDAVRLDGRVAGSGSGRKVLSLVASVLVGGCCIDDVQRLRSGSAAAVLPFAVVAPSTAGSFLRSFTFGHVRQLDKAAELGLVRAWSVGAAPSVAEMTVDLDSTVCEVCGKAKHGAAYGHTKVLGYHPLVAVRSDTGEVLHSRMRSGSSQRGNERFARETLARARRLAAVTVRADAGFFSYDMIAAIGAHGASYSITIPQNAKVKAAIAATGDDDWQAIAYTRGGEAQVAETTIEPGRRGDKLRGDDAKPAKLRLVMRRSRLLGAQGELWPNWRYHCFVTDRHDLDTVAADANHRGPRHSRARHQRPQRRLRAQPLPLRTIPRQRRLARLLRARAQPRPLDRPPRPRPPHNAAHRRGHHPQPAPHRAGPPRQPQRPTQTPPAAQLALAEHLHHRPGTHPQPAPAHLSGAQRPAQRSPTPSATNPPQPPTPTTHAPKRAGPPKHTSPAATRPQPPIPQTRRWIQGSVALYA